MTYQEDAFRILNDATPATDRALLAWAAGAALHPHAQSVWYLLHGLWQHETAWTNVGGRGNGGTDLTPGGVRILRRDCQHLWLTWPEIAAPLSVLGADVRAELEAALRARAARAGVTWPPAENHTYSAVERQQRRIANWEYEEQFHDLGDRLWGLCHPDVVGVVVAAAPAAAPPVEEEPTDLLALLAMDGGGTR